MLIFGSLFKREKNLTGYLVAIGPIRIINSKKEGHEQIGRAKKDDRILSLPTRISSTF